MTYIIIKLNTLILINNEKVKSWYKMNITEHSEVFTIQVLFAANAPCDVFTHQTE